MVSLTSTIHFYYVPCEPAFVPTPNAAPQAKAELEAMLPATEAITIHFLDEITFIDADENWDGVYCPNCGANAEAWWRDAMDETYASKFNSLNVRARCCGIQMSLNELRYVCPIAFGRFYLQAENTRHTGLSGQQLAQLGVALDCSVREVKAHL